MSVQYRTFAVTIPAGTPKASPVTVDMSFPPFAVDNITVRVPPGPLGQVGYQIASSGQQVIPWNAGAFEVDNDVTLTYPTTNFPDSGSWQLIGYNTGVFDHTLSVRFALTPPTVATPTLAVPNVVDLSTVAPVDQGAA